MKPKIELTSKVVLAIIGLTSVGAVLVPTYAVPTIRSGDIFDGEVKTTDLANGAVTNSKLATDAVTSSKIKNGEVKAEDIAAGVIPSGGGALPNVHVVLSGPVDIPAGGSGFAQANCPDGEKVTGGGYSTNERATNNFPDGNSWVVLAVDDDDTPGGVQAYAVCMGPSQ
jgi:hypothetical protein